MCARQRCCAKTDETIVSVIGADSRRPKEPCCGLLPNYFGHLISVVGKKNRLYFIYILCCTFYLAAYRRNKQINNCTAKRCYVAMLC